MVVFGERVDTCSGSGVLPRLTPESTPERVDIAASEASHPWSARLVRRSLGGTCDRVAAASSVQACSHLPLGRCAIRARLESDRHAFPCGVVQLMSPSVGLCHELELIQCVRVCLPRRVGPEMLTE